MTEVPHLMDPPILFHPISPFPFGRHRCFCSFTINRTGEFTQLKNRFHLCFAPDSSQGMHFPPISSHVYKVEGVSQCLVTGNHRTPPKTGLASPCVDGIAVLWALTLPFSAADMQTLVCCNCIHSKNVMD